jgi:hypothetical protein
MTTFLRLLAASIALLPLLSYGAAFPYITLNKQTNRFSDNGISLTYNGIPLGGGSTNALTMSGTPAIGDLPIALDTSGTAGAWSGLLNIARIALPTPNAPRWSFRTKRRDSSGKWPCDSEWIKLFDHQPRRMPNECNRIFSLSYDWTIDLSNRPDFLDRIP